MDQQAAFEIESMMWTEVMQSDDAQVALKTFLAVDPIRVATGSNPRTRGLPRLLRPPRFRMPLATF